jgi:membrane-associated protein
VSVVQTLLTLPPWVVVALVALLPALEASMFLGVVIPGETAILAGGVVAHAGVVPLWLVMLAACAGAAVGDQGGYTLGRRYGARLLSHLPERVRDSGTMERALLLLRRRGAVAVVIGRWVAALRAVVPAVAGMSGLDRRRFTIANLIGGTVWATVVAVAGYMAGASYTVLERRLGLGSEALFAITVVLVLGWFVHRHHSRLTRS